MNQEFIERLAILKLVIEGYLLTKYADDTGITENLRAEGLAQRIQYYKNLVTMVNDLNSCFIEVGHAT